MGERIIEVDGVQQVFPDDATDDEIAAAFGGDTSAPSVNGIGPALSTAVAAKAVPATANLAMRFGTNPNAPKIGAKLMKVVAGVASPIVGAIEGGPMGAAAGLYAAPKSAWAGSKVGWFGTKMLQGVARPIAGGLDAIAPYAEAAGKVAGPQGLLDLAQMAEPNRKDIGFLGIGTGTPDPQHPALLNDMAARVRDAIMQRLRGE